MATIWWYCFVVLALEGLLQVVVIAVYCPLTGQTPAVANLLGPVAVPLALVALSRARRHRPENRR